MTAERKLMMATLAPFALLALLMLLYVGPRPALAVHWASEFLCAWLTWRLVRARWRASTARPGRSRIATAALTGLVGGGIGLIVLVVIVATENAVLGLVGIEPAGRAMEIVMSAPAPTLPHDSQFNNMNALSGGMLGAMAVTGQAIGTAMAAVWVTALWFLMNIMAGLLAMIGAGAAAFILAASAPGASSTQPD
jgi:hypothetical protein